MINLSSKKALRIYFYFGDGFRKMLKRKKVKNIFLSYDVAVIQGVTSCHKNRMTTRVITLLCVGVTSLTTSVSTMRFLIKILFILKATIYTFKGSY